MPIVNTWYFVRLKLRSHFFDHASNASISDCSSTVSSLLLISRKILVSSANNNDSDLMLSGRSFIYITKSNGPSTLPWGIPLRTSAVKDSSPFTITVCLRLLRNALIQFRIFPCILYASSFLISLRWGTVSNAFWKSKYSVDCSPL